MTFERPSPGETIRLDRPDRTGDALPDGAAIDREANDAPEAGRPGACRLGAVLGEGPHAGDVVDLNRALALKLAAEDAGVPEAGADSLLPSDMLRFLAHFDRSMGAARAALDFVHEASGRYDRPDFVRAGALEPRQRLRLRAPIGRPGKIVGVARNYPAHARERGATPPSEPSLFLKPGSSVIGPGDDILLPASSREVDYEGELAVVIGRSARDVRAASALEYVAGYTIANDVTARDFQNVRGQSFIGKACDGFAPLGPMLVTRDEIDDPQALALETRVSGETLQSASTKEMCFPVAELVAFASRLMTLEPGDVLLTGTPSGVGAAQTPPRWLCNGDLVEVRIEHLGLLHNHVRAGQD